MEKVVPSEKDWGDMGNDLDKKYAYKKFYGKTISEAKALFYRNVIESSSDLRFMPEKPFQFYVISFRDFVLERNFDEFDSADAANCFMRTIKEMLEGNICLVMPIIKDLMPALEFISENQELYGAPTHIYGDFTELLCEIKKIVSSFKNQAGK